MQQCRIISWSRLAIVGYAILVLPGCETATPISNEFPTTPIRGGGHLGAAFRPFAVDTSYRYADSVSVKTAKSERPDGVLVGWGRYLVNREGKGATTTVLKELRVAEVSFFEKSQIPILPLYMPRQSDLAGTEAMGRKAAEEAAALIQVATAARRAPSRVLVFLDVEPNRSISDEYLLGWCMGLNDASGEPLRFLPAVYANGSAGGQSARHAINAIRTRCPIAGIWFARYVDSADLPTVWPTFVQDSKQTLDSIQDTPVYIWQYFEEKSQSLDFNLVNPDLVSQLKAVSMRVWEERVAETESR